MNKKQKQILKYLLDYMNLTEKEILLLTSVEKQLVFAFGKKVSDLELYNTNKIINGR